MKYQSVGNVIMFPLESPFLLPEALDEIIANVNMQRNNLVDITMEDLLLILCEAMTKRGFNTYDRESNLKELALVAEAIRSMLMKQYGYEHPFQKLASKLFAFNEEDGTLMLENKNI